MPGDLSEWLYRAPGEISQHPLHHLDHAITSTRSRSNYLEIFGLDRRVPQLSLGTVSKPGYRSDPREVATFSPGLMDRSFLSELLGQVVQAL